MSEARFQAQLIKKLEQMFPGCIVLKNDPNYQQGMLDLIILWERYWASLEVKASPRARIRPNQEYFVKHLGEMSYAAIVYPENEEEVLSALQQAFTPRGRARVP